MRQMQQAAAGPPSVRGLQHQQRLLVLQVLHHLGYMAVLFVAVMFVVEASMPKLDA